MSSLAVPLPFEIIDGKRMLKRSDLWRLRYRVQRYMSYLSIEELDERNKDIFTNLTTLTPQGQISLPPIDGESPFPWMELWTHMLEEYGLRGTGMPAGFIQGVQMPIPRAKEGAKGTRELQRRGLNPQGKLIKFGKEGHLREALKTGRWRVAAASSYRSDSCRARQDSELELKYRVPRFQRHPMATNELDERRPDSLVAVRDFQVKASGDYYTSCFARTFIHRLFDDFSANSCLIVMDEKVFTQKMLNAFASFRPQWLASYRRVDYVDPILPKNHPKVHFAKHFRYSYQDEFRFVWIPLQASQVLQSVFIDLGPLTDCCELVTEDQINS
jgi:hypothetical protein